MITLKRNGLFTIELQGDDFLLDRDGDAVFEINGDLDDFDFDDLIEYVENKGYHVSDNSDYDELERGASIEEMIEEVENKGYLVLKYDNRIADLLDYIQVNKLNSIQVDELIDKALS